MFGITKKKNMCNNAPIEGAVEPIEQQREETQATDIPEDTAQPTRSNAIDWEQRRFELTKMLVAQDRRSVVLGKLKATNKQIAANARILADTAIQELQQHPL